MMQLGLKTPAAPKKIVTEKYDYPVITLLPVEGEKKSHKIQFNKACCEQMGFDDNTVIVFGRMEFYTFFIDGQTLPEAQDGLKRRLTKVGKEIANKGDYEAILNAHKSLEVGDGPMELKVVLEYSEELQLTTGKLSHIGNVIMHGADVKEDSVPEEVSIEEVVVTDFIAQ